MLSTRSLASATHFDDATSKIKYLFFYFIKKISLAVDTTGRDLSNTVPCGYCAGGAGLAGGEADAIDSVCGSGDSTRST